MTNAARERFEAPDIIYLIESEDSVKWSVDHVEAFSSDPSNIMAYKKIVEPSPFQVMNRDEFEIEYVRRHMWYDPRSEQSRLLSVIRQRKDFEYCDTHMDLCWKIQQIHNDPKAASRSNRMKLLRW